MERKHKKREDIAILPLHRRNTRRLVGGRGDALVVVGFGLRNRPGPVVLLVGTEGDGVLAHPVATIRIFLAADAVAPALEVEPVEAFAPEFDATIELDLVHQVLTALVAGVFRVALRGGVQFDEQVAGCGFVAQAILSFRFDEQHLGTTEQAHVTDTGLRPVRDLEVHIGEYAGF